MTRVAPIERVMAAAAVVAAAAACALTGEIDAPAGGNDWSDGAAGARLWLAVGVVPVVVAALVAVVRRRRHGARLLLGAALAVALATLAGALLHVADPAFDRGVVAALGAGLDVAAVVLAAAAVGTLLRPSWVRRAGALAVLAAAATAVGFAVAGTVASRPMPLPAIAPLQLPSLVFLGRDGDAVLLVLTFGACGAAAFVLWVLSTATAHERLLLRWLTLAIVTATAVVLAIHVARLAGAVGVGDDFLAAAPRAVGWAAVAIGSAATIIQPELDDAAAISRRVAVAVGMVCILGAAAGLAWFAADVTTDDILPWAPAVAAALTVGALAVPVHNRLDRAAHRWLSGEAAGDAALIDGFGAAAEHLDRPAVLQLLATTARRALRLRWVRASTTGEDADVAVAGAGVGVGVGTVPPPPATLQLALIEGGEQLGLLECGARRGRPISNRDRQLLTALAREAALRLRAVGQAGELAASLQRIERQAAEIAASRTRIVEAAADERRRIERDLHDGVQQDLAALLGRLRVARSQLSSSPDAAAATIANAQDDVRRTLAEVRAIAQGIHPAILDDHGLVPAIEARARRLPLAATVCAAPPLATRRFGGQVEGAAYFVVAEAFANVVKHAGATAVTVEVALDGTVDGPMLEIRVTDDGRGIAATDGHGSGLTNMADRAAALGGHLVVAPGPTGGTCVVVRLPLQPTVRP